MISAVWAVEMPYNFSALALHILNNLLEIREGLYITILSPNRA